MMESMTDWDPELYNRFRRYRAEPFEHILRRLELGPDERMIDLGCGSGENTVDLARRSARGFALGLDSSPAMIEQANALRAGLSPELAKRVQFVLGDLRRLSAAEEYSLVFSNAAMQWVSDHRAVLEACFRALVPSGKMVVQMPSNHQETAQATLSLLAREEPWRSMLRGVVPLTSVLGTPEDYRHLLGELGFVDADCYYWSFAHPMGGPAEVVEWMWATALRPFLAALPEPVRVDFVTQWRKRLEQAYGTTGELTLHFRRLFIWGRRPAEAR